MMILDQSNNMTIEKSLIMTMMMIKNMVQIHDTHAEKLATQMQDSLFSQFLLLRNPHLEFTPTKP